MVTPVAERDGALTPVVSCWPVKAVGAKNASGDRSKQTHRRYRSFMNTLGACVDSPRPHKNSSTRQLQVCSEHRQGGSKGCLLAAMATRNQQASYQLKEAYQTTANRRDTLPLSVCLFNACGPPRQKMSYLRTSSTKHLATPRLTGSHHQEPSDR